jgi:glycine/D-amino acid oxidase-like deaminating enzyme
MADLAASSLEQLHTVDVAVVGLGITGLAALDRALELRDQGIHLKVCGIDAGAFGKKAALPNSAGQLHPGTSLPLPLYVDIQCQELQRKGAKLEEARQEVLPRAKRLMEISLEGCRNFKAMARRLKAGEVYDGVMHLARTAEDARHMKAALPGLASDLGLTTTEWLDKNEVWARLAVARKSCHGGYYHRDGGFFDAPPIYQGFVEGLRRAGLPLFYDHKAAAVEEEDEFLRLVTNKGTIRAHYVIMADALAQRINPEVNKRTMHFHAHAFTAWVDDEASFLRGRGAFEEEANPFLYVTRIRNAICFGYADTVEKPGREVKERLLAKAVRKIEEIAPWMEEEFARRVVDSHSRVGRLSVTTSSLPDLSESYQGRVITSTGLSGLGHSMGTVIGRVIIDHVAQRLGHTVPPEGEAIYEFLSALPKGKSLTSQEKAAYLNECLNPAKLVELSRRTAEVSLHI